MLKRLRNLAIIGFVLFVVILIVLVNAKEIKDSEKRVFSTKIDGLVARIGEEFYTYEHHLRLADPNSSEAYLLAKDTQRDGQLRFTVISRENVPAGHLLERYANWEDAEKTYDRIVRQKDHAQKEADAR